MTGRAPPRSHRLATFRDAADFLESLVRTPPRTRDERERLGLTPVESLLDRIGNPHRGFPAIHITGSQGKGSTALYAEALLAAAGLRTGTFTSPHLETWNERIRVEGTPIDDSAFVNALERVRPHIAEMHRTDADTAPAFFDALVAAAFSVFAGAEVDIAVVETGIGARLDPTRVCRAVATCVTGVDLEHTDRLGSTIADIAREKAAIARRGVPIVAGTVPAAALEVLEREAVHAGAPLRRLGRDFAVRGGVPSSRAGAARAGRRCDGSGCREAMDNREGTDRRGSGSGPNRTVASTLAGGFPAEITLAGRSIPVRLRQPGRHMLDNAALALALVDAAGALTLLDDGAAGAALESAMLPGRAEVLREHPLVVADGAHTRAAVDALVEVLGPSGAAGLVAVVSVTRGRDAVLMLASLVRRCDAVFATAAEPSRSLPSSELARALEASGARAPIIAIDDPADAIRAAVRAAGDDGTVCATGSMYMAGAARRVLRTA